MSRSCRKRKKAPVKVEDVNMHSADDPLDLQLMWMDHREVLLQVLQVLRHKEVFADATLICGKKRFEVHQFVLSTCSLYLEELFWASPCDHPILMFPNAPPTAMEHLLNFMYLGQTDLTSEELDQLLELAEELQIVGLIHNSDSPDIKSQVSSLVQKGRKKQVSVDKDKGAVPVKKAPEKTTKKKISQAPKKSATVKSISATSQKTTEKQSLSARSQNIKEKRSLDVKSQNSTEKRTSRRQQQHKPAPHDSGKTKPDYKNSLFSCPECPFKALTSPAMNQHIAKHSAGKPYMCPHCQLRHPLKELHIAHQRRNHPKMEIIVNKSPTVDLDESVNTGHESDPKQSLTSAVPQPSPVKQTCTQDQDVSSQPLSSRMTHDSLTLTHTEPCHDRLETLPQTVCVVKTETFSQTEHVASQRECVAKAETFPQTNYVASQTECVTETETSPQTEHVVRTEAFPSTKYVASQTACVAETETPPQIEYVAETEVSPQTENVTKTNVSPQTDVAKTDVSSQTLSTGSDMSPCSFLGFQALAGPQVSTPNNQKDGSNRKPSALGEESASTGADLAHLSFSGFVTGTVFQESSPNIQKCSSKCRLSPLGEKTQNTRSAVSFKGLKDAKESSPSVQKRSSKRKLSALEENTSTMVLRSKKHTKNGTDTDGAATAVKLRRSPRFS